MLFLISINDLPSAVSATTILYADDTTFLNISNNLTELETLSQITIATASNWFKTNGFLLNESKTHNILFNLKRINTDKLQTTYVDTVKFLGIFIDNRLNWEPHINYLTSRLSRVVFLLRRLTLCVHADYVRTAYFAFFSLFSDMGL